MNISFPVLHTEILKKEPVATQRDLEILAELYNVKGKRNNTIEDIIDNNTNNGWAYGD